MSTELETTTKPAISGEPLLAPVIFEYGAVSSKFSCEATNKLTAYCAMVSHYNRQAHLIAIYSPEESKADSWLCITGQISDRLDEIFKEEGGFDKYFESHIEEIKTCYKSIKRIC